MKISVIIPIYNVDKYLRRCIDSVLGQTYEDFEVILVDDGSPDDSSSICDFYADICDRVVVIHQENRGLSAARNAGMRIMTGEYVYFLDGDDYINPDTLEVLSKRLSGGERPDLVIGKINNVDEQGQISYPGVYFRNSELDCTDLASTEEKFRYFFGKSYGTSACNKLYKCSLLKDLSLEFEPNVLIYAEDFLFNLKLFVNKPSIHLVDEYTYNYCFNRSSIQNSFKHNLGERYENLLKSFVDYAGAHGKLDSNRDLLAFSAFTAIDNTLLNVYNFSSSIRDDMLEELRRFKLNSLFEGPMKDLAVGKYLDKVHRKDWKWFARVFAILYSRGFMGTAVTFQFLRHKVRALAR